MPRDPEKRARSREMDKIRKQTRRAIERLEKFSEETKDMRKRHAAKQQLTQLQAKLDQTYAGKRSRTYSQKALSTAQKLKTTKHQTLKELRTSSYDFKSELNKASRGGVSLLGEKGQLKVQMFYRATQNAWQGMPNNEREQAIKDALGVDSLEQAYNKVMNTPEMREVLRDLTRDVKDTNALSEAYEQAERTPKRIDTPLEVMRVQVLEFTKAYAQSL